MLNIESTLIQPKEKDKLTSTSISKILTTGINEMSLVQELHKSGPLVHKSKRPQPHLVIKIYMYIYNLRLFKKKNIIIFCVNYILIFKYIQKFSIVL